MSDAGFAVLVSAGVVELVNAWAFLGALAASALVLAVLTK